MAAPIPTHAWRFGGPHVQRGIPRAQIPGRPPARGLLGLGCRRVRARPACRTARAACPRGIGSPDAALGVGRAARRAVGDLDPLAGAGKQHGVVADDVAAANHREPDGSRVRAPRCRLGARSTAISSGPAERRGDDLAQRDRRTDGRIDLLPVVGLDDLDVVAVASARAASSTRRNMTLTPTLMFGANTIACPARPRRSSRLRASSKPVVPITAGTPCRRQAATCASVPAGRVKSISTSARSSTGSIAVSIVTPLDRPRNAVASSPTAGLSARSSAPPTTGQLRQPRPRSPSAPSGHWHRPPPLAVRQRRASSAVVGRPIGVGCHLNSLSVGGNRERRVTIIIAFGSFSASIFETLSPSKRIVTRRTWRRHWDTGTGRRNPSDRDGTDRTAAACRSPAAPVRATSPRGPDRASADSDSSPAGSRSGRASNSPLCERSPLVQPAT